MIYVCYHCLHVGKLVQYKSRDGFDRPGCAKCKKHVFFNHPARKAE